MISLLLEIGGDVRVEETVSVFGEVVGEGGNISLGIEGVDMMGVA